MEQVDCMKGSRPTLGAAYPPGLQYIEQVITSDQEGRLLAEIISLPLQPVVFRGVRSRRTHYDFGWEYITQGKSLCPAEPFPAWLLPIRFAIEEAIGLAPRSLAAAIVAYYPPCSGIGWHTDNPHVFGEKVVSLSLESARRFQFQQGSDRFELRPAPRSTLVLTGPARWQWQHRIPSVNETRCSITRRQLRFPH
jgi:alkylated DNA repair dioxygenase AlkB